MATEQARSAEQPLAHLRRQYQSGLESKVAVLVERWHGVAESGGGMGEIGALSEELHKLSGSAGSYGFSDLSAASKALESALDSILDGGRKLSPDELRPLQLLLDQTVQLAIAGGDATAPSD